MALGYPVYFIMLIGLWKLLGAIAVLVPGFPRLKEWAYAGMFFNMTGAAVSTIAVDGNREMWHVVVQLLMAALIVTSWALRPASRVLGSASVAGSSVNSLLGRFGMGHLTLPGRSAATAPTS